MSRRWARFVVAGSFVVLWATACGTSGTSSSAGSCTGNGGDPGDLLSPPISCAYNCPNDTCAEETTPYACPALAPWSQMPHDPSCGCWDGTNAGYFQVAFSGDVGRLRLGGTFHGQHTFADGRDPLDIMVDLGASVRVAGDFRLGAEYVGQDLEESFDPGAEGGARHFLGPTASMQLWNNRVTLIGGPAIGLSAVSPDFVARVAASVGF